MAKDLIICKNVHDTLLNEKKKKSRLLNSKFIQIPFWSSKMCIYVPRNEMENIHLNISQSLRPVVDLEWFVFFIDLVFQVFCNEHMLV